MVCDIIRAVQAIPLALVTLYTRSGLASQKATWISCCVRSGRARARALKRRAGLASVLSSCPSDLLDRIRLGRCTHHIASPAALKLKGPTSDCIVTCGASRNWTPTTPTIA
ncbi:hypothetical protein EW145_g6804 [Phellinidium pouzarii]|uniref:Uncharacterized protein n=1 Tax=Phellinidium pouzarii TaxID=167371 RepID=A0A4S4KTU5_9AGAM|nr:hypothetical protein EW145_g6804 [Phellinidium pouzarii]